MPRLPRRGTRRLSATPDESPEIVPARVRTALLPRARRVVPPPARRVPKDHMIRVAIIGAGRGGTSLIHILHDDPLVTIVGVADLDPHAAGVILARQLKIPTTSDYRRLLRLPKVDTIIDVTGSAEVADALEIGRAHV